MAKDFVLFEGKTVKFTGEVRKPRCGEIYQYTDGSIGRAVSVKNSYPILKYVTQIDDPFLEDNMNKDDFYMIQAENTPITQKRHYSLEKAKEEATRLSCAQPGIKFYLLKTVGYFKVVQPDPIFVEIVRD